MKKTLHFFAVLLFCCLATKSFGQTTLIADGYVVNANIGPSITNVSPTVSNPVATFSLTQSGSSANLTQVTFTTTGTYSASTDITAFTLYVNTITDNIDAAVPVPSATVTAAGPGLQTINLGTAYSLGAATLPYFFFIVPTFASSPVSGHTIAVASITSSNITVSTGSVSGSSIASGTSTILNPAITGTTPGSRCGTGTVALSATVTTGGTINWFSGSTGGSSLGTGTAFTTPSISTPTTYYAEASQTATVQIGTLSDVPANLAGPYTYYGRQDLHYFSSVNACTINSVDIYPAAVGSMIIQMEDNTNAVIATSVEVDITAAQLSNTVPITIPLGFSVPAGATNWQLGGSPIGTANIWRGAANNTYGPYPFGVNGFTQVGDAGGNSTATGVSGPYTGYAARCYFFNWNVSFPITAAPPRASDLATILPTATGVTATATPTSMCAGNNLALNGTAVGATSYSWTGPGGTAITSPGSLSTGVTGVTTGNSGFYQFTAVVGTCSVTATTASVVVNPLPTPSFATSPGPNTCVGTSVTYATLAGQPSYTWSVPGTLGTDYTISSGGIDGGSSSATLTWLTSGSKTVTVNYTNTNLCVGTTPASSTTLVNALPTPSFTSSAGATTCAATNVIYSTQAGQSAYVWNVPGVLGTDYTIAAGGTGGGSDSVTISWITAGSKTVTVNYTNAASCTAASPATNTTTVILRPTPSFTTTPGASMCSGTNATYTTQASQFSYVWSIPGVLGTDYTIQSGGTTTNSVTIKWIIPGTSPANKTVTVNYSNAGTCAGASPATNTVLVNPAPSGVSATPTPNPICNGSSLALAAVATNATNYSWTGPGGAPIVNPTSLCCANVPVVNSGNAGVYNLTASIGSCSVTVTSPTVVVNALPTPTFTSAATAGTCANSTVTYSTQPSESSYVWTVSGTEGTDYIVASGGTSSLDYTVSITWLTAGSQTVTVNYTDANGCTSPIPASSTTIVHPQPVPSFIAAPPAAICANTTVIYTTQSAQSSYSWSVPGTPGVDYNIISGGISGTDNTVTLTWITPNVNIVTANYVDGNGCVGISPATNTVLINPLPASVGGPGQVCQGSDIFLSDGTSGGNWTSSNSASAPVDPASGDVTGASPGTATIIYALSTGCSATTVVTVNPLPFVISGNNSVCIGSNTMLSDAGGGTWSSSDETLATIDLNSGVVTGLSFGPLTITYTLATNCLITESFSVNPFPSNILGVTNVCTGATTGLSDPDNGGTWMSSNTFFASVNLNSGLVSGVHTGGATITYTLPTGCQATTFVVVNPTPVAISGSSNVCVGSTITLGDGSSGGSWTTSDPLLADITGPVVTGIATGAPTITYTLPAGCFTTKSILVNPLPSPIAGVSSLCIGATSSFTDPDFGGTWSSSNTAFATAGGLSGIVTGVAAGTVNIFYTFPSGCNATIPVAVNLAAPNTGATNVCTGATSILNNSYSGGAWSSSNSSLASVDPSTGTVTGITPGVPTISYTALDGCISTTSVVVNATPSANLVTGGGNICVGSSGVAIGLNGSIPGVTYQLFNGVTSVGPSVLGTGTPINFGLYNVGGIYRVVATNGSSGCSTSMTGAAPIVVSPLPTVYTVTGGGSYCAGGIGRHVGLSGSHPGISYQLFYGITHVGAPINGTGFPLDFGTLTDPEAYHVIAINDSIGSCSIDMAGSAPVIMNPLPVVHSVTGGGHACSFGPGAHIGLDGSNSGINYQLYNTSGPVGFPHTSASGPIDFGAFTVAGNYSVIASNAVTTCSVNMTSSATVIVDPTVVPSVSLSTGTGVICGGNLLHITATPTNGGLTPAYSWSLNGLPVTVSGGTYSYLPSDGDHVSVVLTSSAPCPSPSFASSALDLSVIPSGAPSVTINVSPNDTVCQGTGVLFTSSTLYAGGAPTLSWVVNSLIMGSGTTFAYTPANHDAISCILGSNYQCRTADSGMSNTITMQVDPHTPPTVFVTANPGLVISFGDPVTFTANVSSAGPSPSYQWFINGIPVSGDNSNTLFGNSFNDHDSISCKVISDGICPGLSGSGSAKIQLTHVGVQQIVTAGSNIRLLPNPNKGTFTLKGILGSPNNEEVSLMVTNMLGQVVYNNNVTAQNGVIDAQVLLNSNLANGMYLLNLRAGDETAVFHFVIEK